MRNKRFPKYPDDVDYTTNSPSYYDDLARKQKLIQLSAEKIFEYENTLNETLEQIEQRLTDYILENDSLMNERLENWDQRIDDMPEEMRSLFVTWLNDGIIEQIINYDVLGNKADKTFVDAEIERLDQKDDNLTIKMDRLFSNPLNHGAMGDGVTDDTQALDDAFSENKNVIIPEGEYRLHKLNGLPDQRVVGIGKNILNIEYIEGVTLGTVLAGLKSRSHYENLHIKSMEEFHNWNRVDMSSQEDIYIKQCTFEGFRHGTSSADANAWGLYMKNSKRITIDQCEFYDNTQADIAITGGTEDVLIMNPKGPKLHLNIEPNMDETPVKRIKIVGGHFHRVSIVNPSQWKNHIIDVVFESCEIDNFYYRGGDVEFIGCTIKNVIKADALFSGKLKLNDSVQQTANLIKDDTFKSIGDDEGYWKPSSPSNEMFSIMSDGERGRFVRVNPTHKSSVATLIPTEFISVSPNDILMFEMVGSAKYTATGGFRGQTAQARFYDSADTELSKEILYFKGGDLSEKTEHNRTSIFIHVPENATKLKIYIGNGFNTTDSMLDIESVSLTKINKKIDGTTKKSYIPKVLNIPIHSSFFTTDRYYKGDILYNENVESGGYIGWVCIEGGNPGSWKGFGLIE